MCERSGEGPLPSIQAVDGAATVRRRPSYFGCEVRVLFNADDVTNQDLSKNIGSVRGFDKLAMSTKNQNKFFDNLRNVFIDFVGGLKPKKEKNNNNENLKPVSKTSTPSSEGLGEINDVLSKLSTPTETLETENDVIDISLNPVDLNKLETLGMVT